MNQIAQWILAGLLVIVIVLQVLVIKKMPGEAEVPSLKEIDQRIMHWTMHHGSVFSASSRVSALETKMDKRFDTVEKKLSALAEKTD